MQVKITYEAARALEEYNARETGRGIKWKKPLGRSGLIEIELDDEVFFDLVSMMGNDETISDVLIQLADIGGRSNRRAKQ